MFGCVSSRELEFSGNSERGVVSFQNGQDVKIVENVSTISKLPEIRRTVRKFGKYEYNLVRL